ncbi:MAG: efflux RND transporter permease subunit [Bacteroidales bacterium]|nr:efflux RND transporter permease subunit [Bacteroidales bacterium]
MQLKTFIKRPVLSSVISILIIIVGIMGLTSLPVEQYPDIAPPTVSVTASYYGASAQTIQKSVIAPLEEAINGVENMMYMTSTSSNTGSAEITIFFEQGTDPDKATVNVQNRVSQALAKLPAEVRQNGVTTMKQQNSILQIFAISSPDDRFDSNFLSNYLNINLKPKIMRITGVGKLEMFGAEYSMRVWLKPEVLAGHNLTPSDILAALSEQNIEAATGTFGDNSPEQSQYTMIYSGRLKSVEEFERIIVRENSNGEILYLGQVADVELGAEHYMFNSEINGHAGAICVVYQTAGSNAKVVNESITELIAEEQAAQPDIKFDILMDTNDFLNASIHEVIKTLLEALALVIIIVLLFLHDWQSTLIPFVGIFVSLIGTFAFMMIAGFSVNMISLFALVLVIGTVVDDSIVVVEAVHTKLDAGYSSPMKAAVDAMDEITTAVITSSLVFMAVFIPVSMMPGTSGTFFRQFGLTMAVAVGISAINALTLSPALCALLIKPHSAGSDGKKPGLYKRFSMAFDTAFEKMSEKYKNGIKPFIKRPWLSILVVIASVVLMVWSIKNTPTGFVPMEDKGVFMCDVVMPASTSLSVTTTTMQQIAAEIEKIDEVVNVGINAGFGFTSGRGSNTGFIVITLKEWAERDFMSIYAVMQDIYTRIGSHYPDAELLPFMTPMIPGYGASSDAEIYLQDKVGGEITDFAAMRDEYVAALNRNPSVGSAYSSFTADNPQWYVNVDIARCKKSGIALPDLMSTLSTYMGGAYVNDVNLYGKTYKVMVQGTPESHVDETSLSRMFVRTASGELAPLSNYLSLRRIYGSASLSRFNLLNSIQINASPADGASTGDLIQAVKDVADEVLPSDYTIEFGGMTREQSQGSSMLIIFGISALLIYLILSCLYESYVIPFAIMLAVPMGLMGAFLFTKLFGLDNNIYLQTGVVMLIGLLAKTGILIVEFALQKRHEGLSIKDSALEAAKARLRPIFMTAGTMVIGLLPLITSTGVGAMGNISLGIGAVFGMLIGCLGLLFLVPALFVLFETIQEKIKPLEKEKEYEEL